MSTIGQSVAGQGLAAVLAAIFADRSPAFEPIRLDGGLAVDRGAGIIELLPHEPAGSATVLSAGIHGNETAPLELLYRLAGQLDRGLLSVGAPTLLLVGHPASIVAGTRYLETNLNRLFRRDVLVRGEPMTGEHARAETLMGAVDAFWAAHPAASDDGGADRCLHLDLHTAIRASVYPRFVVEPFSSVRTPASLWQSFSGAGLQAVLFQHCPSWTFSHYSRHYHGVPAFTLELGRVAAFGANDLAPLAGTQALLAARIAGQAGRGGPTNTLRYFHVCQELMRESDVFSLAFADDTPNFTAFDIGTILARDGQAGDTVVADAPVHVVFPNAYVERGARAALLARPGKPPTACDCAATADVSFRQSD